MEVEGVLQKRESSETAIGGKYCVLAYIAHTPSDSALLAGGRCLVGLALDAQVHDVVPANRAVVHDNVWKRRGEMVSSSYTNGRVCKDIPQAQRATAFH